MFDWYRGLIGQRGPRAVRVRCPTLLAWGAQDVALDRTIVQPSIDCCDDGRLVVLEQATHWVQHEEAARISALLSAHFLGASSGEALFVAAGGDAC